MTKPRVFDPEVLVRKVSVSIPYKQRLHNLGIAFEGLARQTLPRHEFEVVLGAMEYSAQLVELCRSFEDRIDIVAVLSAREFHIPRARNLAMRQAAGEVIVQMDADTLLPPTALEDLYERSFAFGQKICVVGQVLGYGNNHDGDVLSVDELPYAYYCDVLDGLSGCVDEPADPRFTVPHVIPWAFAWTGLIAIPRAVVHEHNLWFDEDFRGWGGDDLDWGVRISRTGTPIVLRPELYALHLPHLRDQAANEATEKANYRRLLAKWLTPDIELANAFGDFEANLLYRQFMAERQAVIGADADALGSVLGTKRGARVLTTGVRLDNRGLPVDFSVLPQFDAGGAVENIPLAGFSLPLPDASVDECRVLPTLRGFSDRLWMAAVAEAERLAGAVVLPETAGG